ncbi:MAG: hypothetical protein HKO95_14860 [Rhodobacteraceae bacterium]|nr:hypothetical protein [Alphaproteobacteria bacterium]NNK68003.1 hypothetical protein [Paracoccaceae bacterium]
MNRRTLLASGLALAVLPLAGGSAHAQDAAKIRDLYSGGVNLSDWALAQVGERVTFEGYMAPPLKANSNFFVLTALPMSVCPFCETEAEWPNNIVAVYSKRVIDVMPFNRKIEVRGRLETGSYRDPDTGFLSLVRIEDATYG